MMAVEVFAWNVADGFSDQERSANILKVVQQQQPTAAVFSEAWHESEAHLLDDVLEAFEGLGYAVTPILYEDAEERDDRHGILGIVRTEAVDKPSRSIRLASRSAIHLSMADPESDDPIDLFGVHLNDRNESSRLEQAHALLEIIGDSSPAVVGGDFNAMHRRGVWPQVLAVTAPLLHPIPEINYAPDYTPPKVHHILDGLRRASEMACGSTLQAFADVDFRDAHPQHRPTMLMFNVDHILARGLQVIDRQIHAKTPDSDHQAISAVLA
jgi:endonuclease/exonuclease/phosphatase family metal-dependent hydrolase